MKSSSVRPLITTVIPTYCRPKQLIRAIRSILSQTYSNFQVCVYDNHSCDETSSLVQEIALADLRVKYHCHNVNIGALNNFLFGMKRVETPFFSMLSDDDVLLPDFYRTAMEELHRFPDAVFSGSATIAMTEDGKIRDVSSMWAAEGYYIPPEGLFQMMENNLSWNSVLFRKEVIDQVGELDLEVGAPNDYDFLLRIAARFPFVVSRRPGAIWVDHPLNSCARANSTFVWPGWLKMIRNLTEDERIPFDVRSRAENILTSQLKRKLFWIGSNSIRQKNFEDAYKVSRILKGHFRQAAKANLISFLAWCGDNLPPTHRLLLLINRVRKIYRWNKSRSLQKQFGKYSRFINGAASSSKR